YRPVQIPETGSVCQSSPRRVFCIWKCLTRGETRGAQSRCTKIHHAIASKACVVRLVPPSTDKPPHRCHAGRKQLSIGACCRSLCSFVPDGLVNIPSAGGPAKLDDTHALSRSDCGRGPECPLEVAGGDVLEVEDRDQHLEALFIGDFAALRVPLEEPPRSRR